MAASTCEISWEDFIEIHKSQLQHIGLPQHLWKELYSKLSPVVRKDAKGSFERQRDNKNPGRWFLHAKRDLAKEADVFIVEHAWTSDGGAGAKKKLVKTPELVPRLQDLMGLCDTENNVQKGTSTYVDSSKAIQQISGVTEEKAHESLDTSKNDLIDALMYAEGAAPPPRLSENEAEKPPLTFEEFKIGFKAATEAEYQENLSEEFLAKMYKKYLKDREEEKSDVQYGRATTAKYSWEENTEEKSITVLVSVPQSAKKSSIVSKMTSKHWSLGLKGSQPIIDGDFYSHILPDECFWTFDGPGVIQMTLQKRGSEEGMWPVCLKGEKQFTTEEIYKRVKDKERDKVYNLGTTLNAMWHYNQTYQKVTVQGGPQEHCWYIMDEIGSAITHSNTPNLKCSPFAYAVNGMTCSLIWLVQDLKQGDICTRNFCPVLNQMETDKHKQARLLISSAEMPHEYPRSFLEDYAEATASMKKTSPKVIITPLGDDPNKVSSEEMRLSLKVYVDKGNEGVKALLEGLGCTSVAKPDDATAQWLYHAVGMVTSEQKTNRLSGEEFLLRRDLMSRMLQKKIGPVSWFPRSYSLQSQLPALCVDHYMNSLLSMWMLRSANPQQFHCKPVLTTDLRRVIRLGETGPLVASHFCISTAIFKKKAFCLQYTVMVPALSPVELHIHNTPRIRQASKQFNPMEELDEYDPSSLVTVDDKKPQDASVMKEFSDQMKKFYFSRLQTTWEEVQQKIFQHIGELFFVLSSSLSALGGSGQSGKRLSAVYGVDVLLQENLDPVIIGINAVPSFANDHVGKEVLFLAYGEHEKIWSLEASRNVTRVVFE